MGTVLRRWAVVAGSDQATPRHKYAFELESVLTELKHQYQNICIDSNGPFGWNIAVKKNCWRL